MPVEDPELEAIREALAVSPENAPLRRRLAELLLEREEYEEAEAEFRWALKMAPADARVMMGLIRAFHAQGKNGLALVVLEEQLLKLDDPPGAGYVLYARVLLSTGKVEAAVAAFRQGVALDPEAADEELAERLGIDADQRQAAVVDGRMRAAEEDYAAAEEFERPTKPEIDFSGVGGMDDVKEEVRLKVIYPLTNKDLYAAYGKTIGGGILLYGPPGCGKTHLARATAGEIKSGFLSVGLHEVLDMWIGQSERKLHFIFQQARNNTPCVLFFDEVDALGASRSDMRQSAGRHLINQFLSELDGVEDSNEGVLILAATNAPWHLDSAFRRPGRFDRIIFVPPPDAEARAAILKIHLEGKPVDGVDCAKVAAKTDGYSGADLKAVIDLAVEAALQEAMKKGTVTPLTTRSLLKACKTLRPSAKEWFSTARNHALYANEGGIYDDILNYLDKK
jgi:transitional endoplasmic reticulum ATPase